MPTITEPLPLTKIVTPPDEAAVAEAVRDAHDAKQPLYPLGGKTSLDYGIEATQEGIGLDLTHLAKLVDYTPRDMTIAVEAGMRVADLASLLAKEKQHLPLDVPRAGEATVGGAVATNWNGPRRYGFGTWRDYLIGIRAVDGRGVPFAGGGHVVKNVAGYDFCKLLTGSMGTLGLITQMVFKVVPLSEQSATLVAEVADLDSAEQMLRQLNGAIAPPVAIDLLVGSAWNGLTGREDNSDAVAVLAVRAEGTESEIAWLVNHFSQELTAAGGAAVRRLEPALAEELFANQVEFSDRGVSSAGDSSPLVIKIAVPPSAVVSTIHTLLEVDPDCTIASHAGNGILIVRFTQFDPADLSRVLIGQLRPAAVRQGGNLSVLACKYEGLTPQTIWGGRSEASKLMQRIQQQFDPHKILNPGRFLL